MMMKVLSIYPNADGYGRIPTGLAIIMTVIKNAGHELALFDTTFLQASNSDNDTREKAGLVKKVESIVGSKTSVACSPTFESLSEDQIKGLLLEKLKQFKPDVVIMSIVEDNYSWADKLLNVVKRFDKSIPVVIGGPTPSAVPHILIENPHVDFLVQGEGEETILELLEAIQYGRDIEKIKNLWYKTDNGVRHNPLRPFLDMNELPIQDVELWDRRHFYKAYDGKLYWTGYFEMSRGCPNQCTYCVNHIIKRSLKEAGRYYRRKKPSFALNEVKFHKEKYDLKRIVFCDDNFLMMPKSAFKDWAKEFKDVWLKEINLPYWINTSADHIRPETLQFLAETGCDGIGLGVESGGEWFRRNILKRNLTNAKTKEAFRLIHDYGIRTTANIMMGCPGEYEEDIFESIKLIRDLKPKSFDVSLVAPYIGTDIHSVCVKLGFIETLDNPGFRGLSKKISFRQFSTIHNPNIKAERISELYYKFADYVSGKLPIPERYLSPAPGANDIAPDRGNLSREVVEIMRSTEK